MFAQLIKKNMNVLLRNKHELIILLVMPIALISILGVALGGLMNSGASAIKAKVYVVEHASEQQELQTFMKEVQASPTIPEQGKKQLIAAAKQTLPISTLKDKVLGNKESEKNIELHAVGPNKLSDAKKQKDTSAIIEVPEGFTYSFLQHYLLGEGKPPSLTLIKNENEQITAGIVDKILQDFKQEYAYASFLQVHQMPLDTVGKQGAVHIEKKTVHGMKTIDSSTYYTIGMSTMFVLYVASTLASFALLEKEKHIYQRIRLAAVSPWAYLGSVMASCSIIGFVQLVILFTFAHFCFGVQMASVFDFILVSLLLSMAVGGLSALLASLSYRERTESFADSFSSVVVAVLAFFGGSFVPIDSFPDWMQKIGELSLNGAGLKAYMKIAQGYDLSAMGTYIATLIAYAVILLTAAVMIFPRKEAK
ncbi:ABC transporter permease [Bacillus sp. 1P06AnD]|uniref:ABC transporter permease n=1 Tax=Bacillus sp. 1P06AnD TaxID=3132208 RepID=UPI0039A35E7D